MTVRKELPFDQVNELALGQYPELLFDWFPKGQLVDDKKEFAIGDLSGTAGGKDGGSVKVRLRTGWWAEMNGGHPCGKDPISLYAWAFCGGDRVRACKELGASFGLDVGRLPAGAKVVPFVPKAPARAAPAEDWRPMVPPPDGIPEPADKLKGWDHVHRYRDRTGRVVRYVVRNDARGDAPKKILPLTYGYLKNEDYPDGSNGWHWKHPNAPRGLYGLDRLDGRPVLLQEGEKKTDAVAGLLPRYACLSLTGGTGGVNHNDLAPLAGLDVLVCGDADAGGAKAVGRVAELLAAIGATVAWVELDGMPDKWDLGNAVTGKMPDDSEVEPWDAGRVEAFLKERLRPFDPDPGNVDQDGPGEDDGDPAGMDWRTLPPIPLGYESGYYYYLSPLTRQIEALARRSHTKQELIGIASLAHYWERLPQYRTDKGAIDWDAIGDSLKTKCAEVGFFDPDRVRGRGAWIDGERTVLHMGDRLLVDGESQDLRLEGSRFVYEAALGMNYTLAAPIKSADAAELLEIVKLFHWDRPVAAILMAGWLVVAPVCGALNWRPSIWVSGGSGSGKSTLERLIVRPVLAGLGRFLKGGTTEAGLRQTLKMDARPVVFDEAEAENAAAKARIQGILDLVRQSSSEGGAEIVKGTQGQTGAKRYHIRSCFMFSSINVSLDHLADESRVTVLELKNPPRGDTGRTEFDALVARIDAKVTPEFCAGLVARSVSLMPVILKNAATFSRAVATHLGSARVGDQIGTLLAGAYALHSNKEISLEDARAWVKEQDWGDTTSASALTDERRMIDHLMQSRVRFDTGGKVQEMTLAELVRIASGTDGETMAAFAWTELKRHGMAWDPPRRGLWVSNTHRAIKDHLAGTPWGSQWARTLRRLPGAEPLAREAAAIRFAGERGRATFLPFDLLD